MISIRERLIRTVQERCAAAIAPVVVLRQPSTAIPRERTPVLILQVLADNPLQRSNDRMERELQLQITAHARDPVDGFAVADELLCHVHVALFADQTLGGLARAIDEQDADYQSEDADVDASAIPAHYRITYRTQIADISQGG